MPGFQQRPVAALLCAVPRRRRFSRQKPFVLPSHDALRGRVISPWAFSVGARPRRRLYLGEGQMEDLIRRDSGAAGQLEDVSCNTRLQQERESSHWR